MAKKKATGKMKLDEKIDIRLRVDGDLHQRIQEAADQEGNSVAAFIRSAVVKELKRREKESSE
jgi:predicted HicB family RNase H-like nuclease